MITFQIPGSTILANLQDLARKLANSVQVDEEHFPQHPQTFTAIYSEKKNYL